MKRFLSQIGPGIARLEEREKQGFALIIRNTPVGQLDHETVEYLTDYGVARALDECIGVADPLARLQEIAHLSKTGIFKRHAPPHAQPTSTSRQQKILTLVKERAEISTADAHALLPSLSRISIIRDLDALARSEQIERVGQGRATRYRLNTPVSRDLQLMQHGHELAALLTALPAEIHTEFETADLIEFIYTNNKLEGVPISFGDTNTAVRTYLARTIKKTKRSPTEITVIDHVQAFEAMRRTISAPYRPGLLLQLHDVMFRHDPSFIFPPGQHRKTEAQPAGVDLTYIAPTEIPQAMAAFEAEWSQFENTATFDTATLTRLIGRLLFIHPFEEGNGRIARLLLNRYLMRFQIPPITFPVTKRFDFLRATYFANRGDIAPLRSLIQDAIAEKIHTRLAQVSARL